MSQQKTLAYPFPMECLEKTTVNDVFSKKPKDAEKKLVDAEESATIGNVLDAMRSNHVKGIPIRHQGKPGYCALVTMHQLLAYLVMRSVQKESGSMGEDEKSDKDAVEAMIHVLDHPLTKVMEEYQCPIHAFPRNEPLKSILTLFKAGIHYVLIETTSGDASGRSMLLTQGDVAKFMQEHCQSQLKEVCGMSIQGAMQHAMQVRSEQDLNQLAKPVEGRRLSYAVRMPHTLTAFRILKSMLIHRLSTIAIVHSFGADKHERIITNLSSSDFRKLTKTNARDLLKPVCEWLAEDQQSPLTLPADSTLGEVLKMCVENEVHGVWVLDEDGAIKGRVSLTDVFAGMMPDEKGQMVEQQRQEE